MAKKMSATAHSWEGKSRTCRECGESKPISITTFSLLNSDPTGWHKVCRVCQGVAQKEKNEAPLVIEDLVDSEDDLINEMYYLAQMKKDPDRLALIVADLQNRVRAEPTEKLRFGMFLRIVQPLIAGWQDPGPIHGDILDGLLNEASLRTLIIATRFSAKSTLTGVYVAYQIFMNPLIKIMVISRGEKLASRMLRTVRRVYIEHCPILWHLQPDPKTCLDNSEQFQTPQSATVVTGGVTFTSLGIGSNLPGLRADLTIGDDVEGTKDDTPEKVQDLVEVLNELHMINPKGRKILLGTYQSEHSVYAYLADLLTADGTPVWDLHRACMFEEDDKLLHSRWPGMFSDAYAYDLRNTLTKRAWRLHMMLVVDPTALRDKPLKLRDLPVLMLDPMSATAPLRFHLINDPTSETWSTWGAPRGDQWSVIQGGKDYAAYGQTVAAIDPASGLAGRDAIGLVILSVTVSGYAVIRHLEAVRGPSKADSVSRVAQAIKTFRCSRVIVEELADGFFGSTLEGMLNLIGYPQGVTQVTTGGVQKGRRIIESLAPVMSTSRLLICHDVISTDHCAEFINQMVQIAWDRSSANSRTADDLVDALAHGVASVKGQLIGDVADNIAAVYASRLSSLAEIPLRQGGLKEASSVQVGRPYAKLPGETHASFADQIATDSEVEIQMQTRIDLWEDSIKDMEVRGVVADINGRGDARILWELRNKLGPLKVRLKELREEQVV
jgi:hypothetical protein